MTVNELWEDFKAKIIPPEVDPVVVAQMKLAFENGAFSVIIEAFYSPDAVQYLTNKQVEFTAYIRRDK